MACSLRVRVRDLCDVVLMVFQMSIVPESADLNRTLLIKKLIREIGAQSWRRSPDT